MAGRPRTIAKINMFHTPDVLPEMWDAVHAGVEIVARHLGRITTVESQEIELAVDGTRSSYSRYVNVDRANFNEARSSDLAIIAANDWLVSPRRKPSYIFGIAFLKPRIGLVDARRLQGKRCVTTTTAHEIGHLIGLTESGQTQHDAKNPLHCIDKDCIMFYQGNSTRNEEFKEELAQILRKRLNHGDEFNEHELALIDWLNQLHPPEASTSALPLDFCSDCAADLSEIGETRTPYRRSVKKPASPLPADGIISDTSGADFS